LAESKALVEIFLKMKSKLVFDGPIFFYTRLFFGGLQVRPTVMQNRAAFPICFVDGGSENLDQELHNSDVSESGCMVESRAPALVRLVDGSSDFFYQALHTIQPAPCCGAPERFATALLVTRKPCRPQRRSWPTLPRSIHL
jgi:hypothetical protein